MRRHGLRRRRPVRERAMRPDGVVVPAPLFDQHLGLHHRVEDFPVQQLIAECKPEVCDVKGSG
jgi:hypothetical protein